MIHVLKKPYLARKDCRSKNKKKQRRKTKCKKNNKINNTKEKKNKSV